MQIDSVSSLSAALRNLRDDGRLSGFLNGLDPAELERIIFDWPLWARAEQIAPGTDWTTWLILGGRGAGKTRAGAEWVRAQALRPPEISQRMPARIAIIGRTLDEARDIMVEGSSGLLAVHRDCERPEFVASRRQLIWPGGIIGEVLSADNPDSLRGRQFAAAWCDEVCKWRHPRQAWDMLQFALRLGTRPQQVVTTTPRPLELLKSLLGDPAVAVSRMTTNDNRQNLSRAFFTSVIDRYQGTRLGRQELDAVLLEDREDGLWSREVIEQVRVDHIPDLARIVVAVDPPVTATTKSDACGIIAAGKDEHNRAYILADATSQGLTPVGWATKAIALYNRLQADRIVVETNQGGDMVEAVIRQVDETVPVTPVRATRSKWTRAEPVAALYERGLVSHAGSFPELEDELCDFGPDGLTGGRSPDRLDALVWALTSLMITPLGDGPRVRAI